MCWEIWGVELEDGSETVFLNTRGENPEDVPKELVKFLNYVHADLDESTFDFEDEFVGKLQKTVHEIKQSRRMGERYMLTELLMQDERRAGRAEGRIEGRIEGRTEERREFLLEQLSELGMIPERLVERVMRESDLEKLKAWAKIAIHSATIEQFMSKM